MAFLQFLTDPNTTAFNSLTILFSIVLLLNKRLAPRGFALPQAVVIGLSVCAALAVAAYAGLIVFSQRVGYADHLQVSVANVSWMAVHGFPAYPDLNGGDLYAMIYGPLLFWVNGLAMRLIPSIAVVTILSASALLIGMAVTWRILRPTVAGGMAGLLLTGVMVEQLIPHQFEGFWNRGEPFLYLIAALSLATAGIRNDLRAILVIALLAGVAADIKLTAVFCTAPAAFMVLGRTATWPRRFRLMAYAVLIGTVMLAIPMLIDPSVVRLYRDYLALASGHGLSGPLLRENASFAVAMLMPVLLPAMWRRPRLPVAERWFFGGLLGSVAAETILGGKVMSGPYHLIPLLPWIAFATVLVMTAPSNLDRGVGSARNQLAIVFGVLFLANLFVLAHAGAVLRAAVSDAGTVDAQRTELVGFLDAHPDAEMGVAGVQTYGATYLRPLQVMRNSRLHLDIGAWMDLAEGGVDEGKARRLIENCAVPAWIIPSGEAPFSMYSYYTEKPLFSDGFKAAFLQNYMPAEQGRFYSVWTCRISD